jgi:hypothetical protein
MDNNNVMTMLYDAVLSSPGMGELVKIDLKISRKQVLLLGQVMDSGLKEQSQETSGLLTAMPEGSSKELMDVMHDCLAKAGLTELNEKLRSFNSGKIK